MSLSPKRWKPGNDKKSGKGASANVVPEATEPEETKPVAELMVYTAAFLNSKVTSDRKAMLCAVVSDNAESLKILDEDGNEVEFPGRK